MVCFLNSIAVDQHINMAKSANSVDHFVKPKQINQVEKNKKASSTSPNLLAIPACDKSATAIVDVILLIAVIGASGFLLFPYAKILALAATGFTTEFITILTEEIINAPMLFGCLGLSIVFAVTALVVIILCTDTRCGKARCRGLRKSPEFDIQLETADDSSKKQSFVSKNEQGLLELRREHHPELEAELKKMAPPNGKAVLIYRARCGCSIGRMEVPGPRKFGKAKK